MLFVEHILPKMIAIVILTISKEKKIVMNKFKTEASKIAERHTIELKNFEKVTKNRYPFVQTNEKGEIKHYGFCPSCLNSVQLIGLSHKIQKNPHGKHTGKDIKGFPPYNKQKYQYCPYAQKSEYKQPNDTELLTDVTDDIRELYDLTRLQFDRIVYIIQKTFNIRFTPKFLEKALQQYIVNKNYLYPWLSEANLPYVFAYKSMQQQRCFHQSFKIGSEVYNALKKYDGLKFTPIENNEEYQKLDFENGKWSDPVFRFYNHKQKAIDGKSLKESFFFCIDDNKTRKTIFKKEICFDESYFLNLINKNNENMRQRWLLDIAEKNMPELR